MSRGGPDEAGAERSEGGATDARRARDRDEASELRTFLIADIRGYTTFTQQRGDEDAAKLTAKFAAIVREVVGEFDGVVLELRGDEALCVFASPRQSVRSAIAVQRRFVEETLADETLPLAVGIGIDVGEAVRSEDGYRGGALNLAARLCARAKAGEVLASEAVTHLARTVSGCRYVVLDGIELKGLSEPVRPVRVVPEGEDPARQMATLLAVTRAAAQPGKRVRWLPGRLGRHPRLTVAGAVAVGAVLAGSVLLAVNSDDSSRLLKSFGENSVGIVEPSNGHLLAQTSLDSGPSAAAFGFGSVWTANTTAGTVSRVDSTSHQVSRTINVGAAPSAITIGPDAIWVANSGSGTVSRIDPTTNQALTVAVGASPGGLVVAAGSVWVADTADGDVARIDPALNKVTQTIPVGDSPSGIAAGRDIWVANSASNTVSRIDGVTHAVTQTIHVGNDPRGVAVVGNSVWVTNNLDGTVARIPIDGSSVADTVRVGEQPTQLAALGARIWVATRTGIAEVDPSAARVVRTVSLGATPGGLVGVGGRLWVTTKIDPSLHHGGTLRLIGSIAGSVDPTYLDDISTIWLLNTSYDRLVGFRHAAGADGIVVVPDLATALPEPTNGGLTYSFQLRAGIRWSTGQPVTGADVKRGIERGIATGFSTLQGKIAGSADCTSQRCDISGITASASSNVVDITLTHPDSGFLGELATGGVAVPESTPLVELKTMSVAATGPYAVTRFDPGKLVVLTRNNYFHEWSAAAQPDGFPDRIEWRNDPTVTSNAGAAVAAVVAGRADWTDARFGMTTASLQARFGSRLFITPTETTHGVALNTRIAPFNDVRVRRALAFAIDRQATAADWPTTASITCQTLPPDFPGHRPYCPYTLRPDASGAWNAPDFAAAQQLVDESGTKGMKIVVFSLPNPSPGVRHVVAALNQLGYHARLSVYSKQDYFEYTANSRHRIQAAFYGWVADDVNPSNFFDPLFRCNGFTPNSDQNGNASEFCDPSIDALMDHAGQLASSPTHGDEVWAQVDKRITDAAAWLPLVNPTWVDVVSTRVHNYVRNPALGVFFDQMWVQ